MLTTGGKTIKNINIWRLNNTLLNNQQITKEIKRCIETNENENTTTPKLWDSVKVVQHYILPQERREKLNK